MAKLKKKPQLPKRYPRMQVVITPDAPGLYESQCDSSQTVHCCPKCSHLFV